MVQYDGRKSFSAAFLRLKMAGRRHGQLLHFHGVIPGCACRDTSVLELNPLCCRIVCSATGTRVCFSCATTHLAK